MVQQKRITRQVKSKQPRLTKPDPDVFYSNVMGWYLSPEFQEVPYGSVDNRERDVWLNSLWKKEPYLGGVLNQAVLIDANRGWTITGGRNQVNRYLGIMHNIEGGKGYRWFMKKAALAYRVSDLGSITEVGREGGATGPMRNLWNVDPTKCVLTGDPKYPLKYYPPGGKEQTWKETDFIRLASMPSIEEQQFDLGFCAMSRAVEITKIMIGIVQVDQERVRAKLPTALLLLQGIDKKQWDDAMNDRLVQMSQLERKYFGSVFTFASIREIAAQIIPLANLPDNFDRQTFTNLLMYAYALVFGYSPDEFWPVATGALGRGTEAEVQHRKATGKGQAEFTTSFQEALQNELPDSILFQFDERDTEGEIMDAQLRQEQVKAINEMYAGSPEYPGLISREEARSLAAEQGLIPEDWTIEDEQTTVDDEQSTSDVNVRSLREWGAVKDDMLRRDERVLRAAYKYPDDPVISVHFDPATNKSHVRLLANYGADLTNKLFYSVREVAKKRQVVAPVILYQSEDVIITQDDVDKALLEAKNRVDNDLYELLTATVYDKQ